MARVKSKAAIRHRKVRKATKGFKQARRVRVGAGKEALLHAGQYAFHGRKRKKRDLRRLWIVRLNAASRENGLKYSDFIAKLKKNKVELDRKILADIAVADPETFGKIVAQINK
jgi:large subunit ribosomal protein L20